MQDIALVLKVPHHAHAWMNAFVVPALGVNGVRAEDLQVTGFDFAGQHRNHAPVLKFEELTHGGGKDKQRSTCVPEDEGLHVSMQFAAKAFVVFPVHLAEVSYLISLQG